MGGIWLWRCKEKKNPTEKYDEDEEEWEDEDVVGDVVVLSDADEQRDGQRDGPERSWSERHPTVRNFWFCNWYSKLLCK